MQVVYHIFPSFRPNIFLQFCPRTRSGQDQDDIEQPQWLQEYVAELQTHGTQAKKAIIYCRYIGQVCKLFGFIMATLGKSAWVNNEKLPKNLIVDMYHSSLDIDSQERVVNSFTTDGNLRCIIATIAFGMGIEVHKVRYIFHWGLSKTIVDYWQEVGRCSRDGEPGTAVLYRTPTRGHVTTDMEFKEMVSGVESGEVPCMREAILSHLWMDEMGPQPVHDEDSCQSTCIEECKCTKCMCCSVCRSRCPCRIQK
ncbi:ATP-dependent DNA helicase Q-like 2 [Patiria miniata]|uniref:DNA 3'-5' helicase n=1 Tax=Patiria miniata TaxID=46514 RepID=A0A914ATU4_PATMI|nr:ATP-dependent DNA helicase Q-like 2 [Patiria miniata]